MLKRGQPSYMQLLGQLNLEDIYIQQAFKHYVKRYHQREDAQFFVQHSPTIPEELRGHKFIGVCDRTLGKKIPESRSVDGGMRGTLMNVGLVHSTGSELFRGYIVFAETNDHGNVMSAVGYRFCDRIRPWDTPVIHWQKPEPGAYVRKGLAYIKEVIYGKACH